MATIRHHTRIDRPADDVWALVTDTGNIADWLPGVDKSTQDGDVRKVHVGEMVIEEQIITNDGDLRRMQYSIVGGAPVESHLATIDVIEDGDGAILIYACDVAPDDFAPILDATLAAGTQAIRETLESA
jgi:carbon monoxide dehydrogenase subunit G